MRTSKIGLALAGVILVGAGCGYKTVTKTNTAAVVNVNKVTNSATTGTFTTGTNTNVATKTVSITHSGAPSFTVASGTIVTFVNNDTTSHHIASNPHPTHIGLPGFESSDLAPGSSYTFTFTKVGSFGYHDHLDPFNSTSHGTVTVTP